MSYEDILYEGVIGRREKKCRCPENELGLPFLNSKMRLMGEGERKWEELRSELQWDPGPCGILCTRVRTWDFAVPTKGSTAGCCGCNQDSHMDPFYFVFASEYPKLFCHPDLTIVVETPRKRPAVQKA